MLSMHTKLASGSYSLFLHMQSIAIGLAYASTGVFRSVTPLYSKYHVHMYYVL